MTSSYLFFLIHFHTRRKKFPLLISKFSLIALLTIMYICYNILHWHLAKFTKATRNSLSVINIILIFLLTIYLFSSTINMLYKIYNQVVLGNFPMYIFVSKSVLSDWPVGRFIRDWLISPRCRDRVKRTHHITILEGLMSQKPLPKSLPYCHCNNYQINLKKFVNFWRIRKAISFPHWSGWAEHRYRMNWILRYRNML